jgi:hypothetical protein
VSASLQFAYRKGDTSEQQIQVSINAAWNDLLADSALQKRLRDQGVDIDLMKDLERCPFVVAPEADGGARKQAAIRITVAFFTARTTGAGRETGKETAEPLEKILTTYLLPRLFLDHGARALGPKQRQSA